MLRSIWFLVLSVSLASCTKNEIRRVPPSKVLENYIEVRFNLKGVEDKEKLIVLTSGEVRKSLEGLTDAEFKDKFLENQLRFKSLKILQGRETGKDQFQVTYEIRLLGSGSPKPDEVVNKKLVILELQNGNWLIAEARNLKTSLVLGGETIVVADPISP